MGVDPDRTYAEVEEALRMIGCMWRGNDGDELRVARRAAPGQPATHDPAPPGADAPPAALPRVHEERHREARGRVRHRRARARLRGARRRRASSARIYDETIAHPVDGKRFVSSEVNDHFSALCPTIVLDDGDEALQIGARGQRFFAEAHRPLVRRRPAADEDTDDGADQRRRDRRRGRPDGRVPPRGQDPGAAEHDRDVPRRPRLRHVPRRDRVRRAARRRRRRRDHVPHPDGHRAAGRVPRDDPPVGRARHPALHWL